MNNRTIQYKKPQSQWLTYLEQYPDEPESIDQIFLDQLKQDFDRFNRGESVSDCAIYVPRAKSGFDKRFKFVSKLALMFFPFDTNDLDRYEVNKTHSYIRFQQLISQLTKVYKAQVEKEYAMSGEMKEVRKTCQRKNFCSLKNHPISNSVLEPTAMEVSVSSIDELSDFFQFLSSNHYDFEGDHLAFNRGICYQDGRMDLCKQVVGPDHIGALMNALRKNTHIKHFLLGNNIIGLTGAQEIAKFLSEHPGYITWYLAGNDLDEEGIKLICDQLMTNTVCQALWLKRNPIKTGSIYLAKLLQSNHHLKILDLHNTGILDEGAIQIMESLKENRTLRNLYLDSNGLTEQSVPSIVRYFEHLTVNQYKGITGLWIDINRFNDEGIVKITGAIKDYSWLKRLNIGSNRITVVGMEQIYQNLVDHPGLIYLDLGCYKSTYHMGELPNNIQDQGAIYITQLIRYNKKLQILDITHNGITATGITSIAEQIHHNRSLLFFNYKQYDTHVPQETAELIKTQLMANRKARQLDRADPKDLMRKIRGTSKIIHIDSLYRNKM